MADPDPHRGWRRWRTGAVLCFLVAFGGLALSTPTAVVGPTGRSARDLALFAFTLAMACTVTAIARWKRRTSAPVWFLYAGLLWPVALVHAVVVEPGPDAPAERPRVRS